MHVMKSALCLAIVTIFVAADPAAAQRVATVLGTGVPGYSDTQVNNPYGIIFGPDGALYFCDLDNQRIRRFDPVSHRVTTVAGNGEKGHGGDGGPALQASLNMPHEIQFDRAGNLYIAERDSHVIRKVDMKTGVISTVAGTGVAGFSGDGGPATEAQLRQPHSIVFDRDGTLLICDIGNQRIRRLHLDTGIIETWAGTGVAADTPDGAPVKGTPLRGPRTMTMASNGDLYLALREGNAILRIDARTQTLHRVAGTGEQGYAGDGGPALAARLGGPKGLAWAPGQLFVADTENHVIRRIDLASGIITTVLGTGTRGDGPETSPLECRLSRPHGLLANPSGGLYVTDSEAHRIRLLTAGGSTPQAGLPRVAPEAANLRADALARSTALLEQFVADGRIAGAVAMVARSGRLAHVATVGSQDLESHVPMTERTLFRIYSMTKPVTAVAAMMLLEEGRFTLDDPVSKYLPEFASVRVQSSGGAPRPPARPITVRDLLLHTSGLNHRTSQQYQTAQVRSRSIDLPQFVRNITRAPLMEEPGTRFRYSESTTVVGRLIEIWSGQPFDAFLEQHIFRPLGMIDTGFYATPAQQPRLAAVYGPSPEGRLRRIEIEAVPFTEKPALLEGAVGLLSTAPDFLRFSQMLLNGGELEGVRLLPARTVQTMVRNGLADDVLSGRRGGAMGWGLGNVDIVMKPDAIAYPANRGEYGWDGTAGTIFWNDPTNETVILLFTQSSPPNPDNLRQRFKTTVQEAIR